MTPRFSRRHFLATTAGMGALAAGARNLPGIESVRKAWTGLLGDFPEAPRIDAEMTARKPIGGIPAWHVRFRSEDDDWVTAYLLVPDDRRQGEEDAPRPAVVCPHSTTGGAGKDRIVGLAGSTPGSDPDPPETSRAYGLELARWGYIALAIDLLTDGERVPEGLPPYNSTRFYEEHPGWSMMGKNTWDMRRSMDFLRTLDFVDPDRIACCGHSLGGHTSLFGAAFDDRYAACVSNGGALDWRRPEEHWSRKPDPAGRSVASYVYIPNFRPYIDDPARPVPADFDGLMRLCAPRPLLVMESADEFRTNKTGDKYMRALTTYHEAQHTDRFGLFTYPGGHNFPPAAKRHALNWLDRWLGHTPAVPTIWPDKAV